MKDIIFPAILAGVALFIFVLEISSVKKGQIEQRIDELSEGQKNKQKQEEKAVKSQDKPPEKLGFWKKPLQALDKELLKADLPVKAEEFLALTLAAALLPAILLMVLTGKGILVILWVLVITCIAFLFLKQEQRKRSTAFDRQLADSLGTMANSLRAGFGFLQAIEMISQESRPPLATEFQKTLKEIRLGVTTEDALQHLCQRIASQDLELIITALLIQRQVGGNLAEVLDRISHTIKERNRIRGEIKTLTAQGRISGMVIGALPFGLGLFLMIVNPEYIGALFQHPMGLALIGAGFAAQAVGVVVIRKIVNIQL
ncbi:MAG: type II secretion system F family protein [Syntrophomonadaceae bacterium]|nr:type II secretion system F family protein [Syntrophomonadaceae bacterium]